MLFHIYKLVHSLISPNTTNSINSPTRYKPAYKLFNISLSGIS